MNTVEPGWVPVERHADVDPGALQSYTDGVPLGRLGEPSDVAGAVAYLVSREADFVTGVRLPVNGGSTTS